MKATCICSHRISAENGRYKDYLAGEVYEFSDGDGEKLWPNFIPYESPAPKKKEGK